jgi:hypothetical protein
MRWIICWKARLNSRQIEGGRVWNSPRTGGRVQEILDGVANQRCDDEFRGNPGPRQRRRTRRQEIELRQRLQAFEGEFDLPAQPIEGEDIVSRSVLKRGDEDDPVCRLERAENHGRGGSGFLNRALSGFAA